MARWQSSSHGSPTEEAPEAPTIVSVSTTFYPGAGLSPLPPDLVFLSADTVFFYVHSCQLLSASSTRWKDLIPATLGGAAPKPLADSTNGKQKDKVTDVAPIVALPELSGVLNIALHAVYGVSCAHYSPSAPTVLAAAEALIKYGVPLSKHAASGTPLFETILSLSPVAPLEFYTLAARNGLEGPRGASVFAFAVMPHRRLVRRGGREDGRSLSQANGVPALRKDRRVEEATSSTTSDAPRDARV